MSTNPDSMDPVHAITVVIPAFNAGRYLGEAIRSVLDQDYRLHEVLVVDDGSTDDTALVGRSFGPPVVCWSQTRAGAAAARNAGIARATGDLIAFLDADDVWAPRRLKRGCSALDREPDLEAVFGHVRQFADHASAASERRLGPPLPGYSPGTLLIRAASLGRVGPFAAHLPHAEVVEWYARAIARRLRHAMLPDVLLYRRLHAANLGVRDRNAQRHEYLRILREAIRGRRDAPENGA